MNNNIGNNQSLPDQELQEIKELELIVENDIDKANHIHPKSVKSLEDAIERLHTEADFAAHSFRANTKETILSLKSTTVSLNEIFKKASTLEDNFKIITDKMHSQTTTLSVLPGKIAEEVSDLPQKVAEAVADSIPQLGKQLLEAQESMLENMKQSLANSIVNWQEQANITVKQLKDDIVYYRQEMATIAELGSKNRMRRLFWILLLAGTFSAIVAGVSSWVINKHFPRSVEIKGAQNLVVKDSQVLVSGPDYYKK